MKIYLEGYIQHKSVIQVSNPWKYGVENNDTFQPHYISLHMCI